MQEIRLHSWQSLRCLRFICFVRSELLASAVVGSKLSAHLMKWVTTFNPDWKDQFLLNNWKLPEPVLQYRHNFMQWSGVIIGDVYNFIIIHLTLILLEGDNRYFGVFHLWVDCGSLQPNCQRIIPFSLQIWYKGSRLNFPWYEEALSWYEEVLHVRPTTLYLLHLDQIGKLLWNR